MDAMNSINAAKREQEAASYEAEAKKIKMIAEAEAEAESKRLQGQGTANQRKALAQGIADSVDILKRAGVSEREANAILLSTQYFDTQASIADASKTNTLFTPLTPVGGGNVLQEILAALAAANAPQDVEPKPSGQHIDWPPKSH